MSQKNKTPVNEADSSGIDELWCDFFECPKCHGKIVTTDFLACATCGFTIDYQLDEDGERAQP